MRSDARPGVVALGIVLALACWLMLLRSPEFQSIRAVDMLLLVASGVGLGVALANLVKLLRTR
jgi:hypothetical protein